MGAKTTMIFYFRQIWVDVMPRYLFICKATFIKLSGKSTKPNFCPHCNIFILLSMLMISCQH